MVGKRVVQSQGQLFFLRWIYFAILRQTCAPFGHVQLVRSHQGARFSLSCLYLHRKSVVMSGVRGALYFAILRRCLRFPLLVYVIIFYQKFLSSFQYSIKFTKDLRKKSLNL